MLCTGRITHLSAAFSSGGSAVLRVLRTVATPVVITHPPMPPVQRLSLSLSCADTPQSSTATSQCSYESARSIVREFLPRLASVYAAPDQVRCMNDLPPQSAMGRSSASSSSVAPRHPAHWVGYMVRTAKLSPPNLPRAATQRVPREAARPAAQSSIEPTLPAALSHRTRPE